MVLPLPPCLHAQTADIVFVGLFTIEMAVKIVAQGLVLAPYS